MLVFAVRVIVMFGFDIIEHECQLVIKDVFENFTAFQ